MSLINTQGQPFQTDAFVIRNGKGPVVMLRAACTAQAVGSMSTAARSSSSSGTGCSWLGWATISVAQPPPVSQQ